MSDISAPIGSVDTAPIESASSTETDPLDIDLPGEAPIEAKKIEQSLKRMLKLKVDGREFEEEVDFGDDQAMAARIQKSYAAEKRMSEAAEERKKAESILNLFLTDPELAMKTIGHDPEAFAEQLIERRLKELEMSPEEKKYQEMQSKIKDYEEREQRLQADKIEKEKEALQTRYQQELDTKLTDALKNHPDLPQSDYSVKRIVNELIKYTKAGIDVDVEDVIPVVKQNINKELRQMMALMGDDQFEKFFGEDGFNRVRSIRKKKLGDVKKPESLSTMKTDVAKAAQAKDKAPEKKMSQAEYFRTLDRNPTKYFKK